MRKPNKPTNIIRNRAERRGPARVRRKSHLDMQPSNRVKLAVYVSVETLCTATGIVLV